MNTARNPEPQRHRSGDETWSAALQDQARIDAAWQSSRQQIERARSEAADCQSYCWRYGDHEAVFQIYAGDRQPTIAALELTQLDHHTPTPRQSLDWEARFRAELDDFGDTWLAVASRFWAE